MSRGPFVAGSNRRILVPSLSQELSSDDTSDESDSSDSLAEHSSPNQTTASSISTSSPSNSTSAARPPTSSNNSKDNLLYKAESFQVRRLFYKLYLYDFKKKAFHLKLYRIECTTRRRRRCWRLTWWNKHWASFWISSLFGVHKLPKKVKKWSQKGLFSKKPPKIAKRVVTKVSKSI